MNYKLSKFFILSIFLIFSQNFVKAEEANVGGIAEKKIEQKVEQSLNEPVGENAETSVEKTKAHLSRFISPIYQSGSSLIYDCVGDYYACVNGDGFRYCRSQKKISIANRDKIISCAPLKRFKRRRYCIKEQKRLIDFPVPKKFCVNRNILE